MMDTVMCNNKNNIGGNISNNPTTSYTPTVMGQQFNNEKSMTINQDNDFNINQYVNNALYSLVKNDQ